MYEDIKDRNKQERNKLIDERIAQIQKEMEK